MVQIEIFHGLFIDNKNYTAFLSTMSIDFKYPSRASYLEIFEDTSVYPPEINDTVVSSSERSSQAALAAQRRQFTTPADECVVNRNNEAPRPCSRQFMVAVDSSNQDLNVALNIEVCLKLAGKCPFVCRRSLILPFPWACCFFNMAGQ
jgi:hypothetical protein